MGLTRNLFAMVIIAVLSDKDMKTPVIYPRGVGTSPLLISNLDGFFTYRNLLTDTDSKLEGSQFRGSAMQRGGYYKSGRNALRQLNGHDCGCALSSHDMYTELQGSVLIRTRPHADFTFFSCWQALILLI